MEMVGKPQKAFTNGKRGPATVIFSTNLLKYQFDTN